VLFNLFGEALVATGIRVDPIYAGGDPLRTITKDGYRVVVNRPVLPVAPLSEAFRREGAGPWGTPKLKGHGASRRW
jgi:hypothetical protein